MKLTPLLPLLLTACAPATAPYQAVLDSYASSAFQGDLQATLTGAALHDASESRRLLVELGWTQVGVSRFEQTQLASDNRAISCLDVSGVRFIDSAGSEVSLRRERDRILMEVDFTESQPPLVARMQEVGSC